MADLPDAFAPIGSAATRQGIETIFSPPIGFVPAAVKLPMVSAAKRHGVFVAYLATKRPWLREFEMMGIAGLTSANKTGLRADEFEVRLVAMAPWFADRKHAFVDASPETAAVIVDLAKSV